MNGNHPQAYLAKFANFQIMKVKKSSACFQVLGNCTDFQWLFKK
jgi:hypothetical protein